MSFEHAPVTKGLMLCCALAAIFVGVFDVKHYLHLQLVPHVSRYHQYWRLFIHHLAYTNSSDLFLAELLLYNVGIHIERAFGSVKFASFALITTLVSTILEFSALLLLHRFGFNIVHSGPSVLLFSILYQYSRLVPSVYHFRVFGLPVSNKVFNYVLGAQLAVAHTPSSLVIALIGLITGQLYRSDLANLKTYRLPPLLIRLSFRFLLPLIGSTRAPRRLHRALPDDRPTNRSAAQTGQDEVITTAPSAPNTTRGLDGTTTGAATTSVMREWMNELTGRADRTSGGLRVPTEADISLVTAMFPDVQREVVVAALQRSPNIEGAVETLLSSQR